MYLVFTVEHDEEKKASEEIQFSSEKKEAWRILGLAEPPGGVKLSPSECSDSSPYSLL